MFRNVPMPASIHSFLIEVPYSKTSTPSAFNATIAASCLFIVSLTAQEPDLNPLIQKYVNRLSDLMFVLARYSEEVENKKWKTSNLNI